MGWFEKIRPWAVGKKRNMVFAPAIFPANQGEFAYFYRKEHPIHYPIVLFSYGLFRDTNISSLWRLEDYVAVLADSGGFQAASNPSENIRQEEVLTWQLKYADAGFMLDYPPFDPVSRTATPEAFEKNLVRTLHSVDILLKHYDDYVEHYGRKNFVLYAVQHGASPKQLEKWHKQIVDPLFETGIAKAIALGGAVFFGAGYTYYLSYFAAFFEHMGHKNIHFLGIGSSRSIESMVYLIDIANKYGFDTVSSDNSYASKVSKNMIYLLPANISSKDIFLRAFKYTPALCLCPVCRRFKEKYGYWPFEHHVRIQDKEISSAIFAHNLYVTLQNFVWAEWLLASGYEPERDVALAREMGYERFWQKYCREFPKATQQLAGGCRTGSFW